MNMLAIYALGAFAVSVVVVGIILLGLWLGGVIFKKKDDETPSPSPRPSTGPSSKPAPAPAPKPSPAPAPAPAPKPSPDPAPAPKPSPAPSTGPSAGSSTNADCVWNEWVDASSGCLGGFKNQTRTVKTPAKGSGKCDIVADSKRFTACVDSRCYYGEKDVSDCVADTSWPIGGRKTVKTYVLSKDAGASCDADKEVVTGCKPAVVNCLYDWVNDGACGADLLINQKKVFKPNNTAAPFDCGELTRKVACTNVTPVDCKVGDWSSGANRCGSNGKIIYERTVKQAVGTGRACTAAENVTTRIENCEYIAPPSANCDAWITNASDCAQCYKMWDDSQQKCD